MELQRIKLLEYWKQRCGSKATYRVMIEALLQINRTDLAEKIIGSVRSVAKDKANEPHISSLKQDNPPSPSRNTQQKMVGKTGPFFARISHKDGNPYGKLTG